MFHGSNECISSLIKGKRVASKQDRLRGRRAGRPDRTSARERELTSAVHLRFAFNHQSRSLALRNMPAPTPQQISTLYKNSLAVSRQFASYNFRTCAHSLSSLLRSPSVFLPGLTEPCPRLPLLFPLPTFVLLAPPDFVRRTETRFAESAVPPATDKRALTEWYNARVGELGVLRRSAVVNRIYEGPRLVVEKEEKIVEVS